MMQNTLHPGNATVWISIRNSLYFRYAKVCILFTQKIAFRESNWFVFHPRKNCFLERTVCIRFGDSLYFLFWSCPKVCIFVYSKEQHKSKVWIYANKNRFRFY